MVKGNGGNRENYFCFQMGMLFGPCMLGLRGMVVVVRGIVAMCRKFRSVLHVNILIGLSAK